MQPNIIIDGNQLETYLKQYNIDVGLAVFHFKTDFELIKFVTNINTSILYKNGNIVANDVNFTITTTEQEKDLIVIALNKLKKKVN